MPIDSLQKIMHLRTKKNQQVVENIQRLWEIGRHATSGDDILTALHPWGSNNGLYFYNNLPRVMIILAALMLIFGGFVHPYIPYLFNVLAALLLIFAAYLIYESDEPVTEVIAFLEQRMLLLRYDLHFNQVPQHLAATSSTLLVISKLKQTFPLFSQGNLSNDISNFAATTWHAGETQHQILLFQYQFVDEISLRGLHQDQQKIRTVQHTRWGAFVFQMPALGLLAGHQQQSIAPYRQPWQSSDILFNQNIDLFGYDLHQLAKNVSPYLTLKLSDFFQHYSGNVIYHFQENIMCYVGKQNLFIRGQNKQKIRNISILRGHLRTLSMPEYEKFKQRLLNLITS